MVTVTNYHKRKNASGKEFITLEIQGGLEMIQSQQTGKFYATAKKCNIPSTFDESTAKMLLGTQMPGTIERIDCDPYDYTVQQTGEVISLAHTYLYQPELATSKSSTKQLQEN
ncbi:hypothetical protein HGH93_08630 [Chitinophaga polysaccharea]|uniref:hypothetical protein n=1 Tax=Chitinophaga polysaccharea TaxID=1293035 RepID=UPI00145527CF|nr:hypothetical protein [Chitinophaga polysaccharea]NLR58160.1 hypothetical protein [Chitinophaga polysaccharea]